MDADPIRCPPWLLISGYAFLYWLAFLLVLEPGNVLHALHVGRGLNVGTEAIRILGAAILGTAATPILLTLTQQFPLFGPHRLRHCAIHLASIGMLAFGLNVLSSLFAAWIFAGQLLPSLEEVRAQLAANWLLLMYAMIAFTAIAHVIYFATAPARDAVEHVVQYQPIPVKTRNQVQLIELTTIDWVETQGNYLALHVGSSKHLIRETALKFEARLNPADFVRIHRRVIVAVSRIQGLRPLANGDGIVILTNGRELRMSRTFRDTVRSRWMNHSSSMLRAP